MPCWMAWVNRPSCLIKSGGSASAFRGDYLYYGRECFIFTNINNHSKLLFDVCKMASPLPANIVRGRKVIIPTLKLI